jgi:ParB-like chromosome segregation protein Spo0J
MARKATAKAAAQEVRREVRHMRLEDLVQNPRNPRVHSEEQIERLMASLSLDGQTKPLLARAANSMLIAGHGVHAAARRLGMLVLDVVMLDVDQARADRIMLGDNRQGDLSTADQARVTELLREIDEADWMATGFSADEVAKQFRSVEATDLRVYEIDSDDRKDTFWISVRGPLADQAVALSRIKVLLREMSKVTVALGTTDDLS